MSVFTFAAIILLVSLLTPATTGTASDGSGADGTSKTLARLRRELERRQAEHGRVQLLNSDVLGKLFPAYDWYAVTFPQYPVARAMPAPMKPSNVFAVPHEQGDPVLINDVDSLKALFRNKLAPVRGGDHARDVARAWLQISMAIHQDGFYQFTINDDSLKASASSQKLQAAGKAVAMRGGNGQIEVTLGFDEKGTLGSATETVKLRPGPRPICQATKLLDPDPIVRKMAEQDLLIMGPAAADYLDEQRTRATPELRQAIDLLWQRIERDDR